MTVKDGEENRKDGELSEGNEKKYKLYTKEMDPNIMYNVIRFCSPRFDVNNLISPITLVRDVNKSSTEVSMREKKKPMTNVTEGGQQKESLDYSKLAPYGNAIKNRQNLFRKMTRTYQMSHTEASEAKLRYKDKNLSKYPWRFSDFESLYHYVGTPEGNQDSTHVLLKAMKGPNNEDAFVIIPVKNWYKFIPQPWYRKPSEHKTDEVSTSQTDLQTPSFPRHNDQAEAGSGGEKELKSWETKFLGTQQETTPKKRERQIDYEDEELDYEEEFADDEEINLGIEDAEDQKEALGRQFGKYSKNNRNRDDLEAEDDDLYLNRMRKTNIKSNLSNNLRATFSFKDNEFGEEASVLGDNDNSFSPKYQSPKLNPVQNKIEKKNKQLNLQLSQKNKKLKKEAAQKLLRKKSSSFGAITDESANLDSPNIDIKRNLLGEAPAAIRNVSLSAAKPQSLTEIHKTLSNVTSSVSSKDTNKITVSPDEPQVALSKRPTTLSDTPSNVRPKKRFVTEEDVINIYMKKKSFTIKAKELASELVLICENDLKSKENLKYLLNKMVKSENDMLHLMPKYRPK